MIIIVVITLIIILLLWKLFTPASANDLPLEFEWQQVSSSLQDSSQYSSRSEQCCHLDGLQSTSYFQFFQSCYQCFGECTKCMITIGIPIIFMLYSFFSSLARSSYLSLFSPSFSFIQWSTGTAKSTIRQVLCILLTIL